MRIILKLLFITSLLTFVSQAHEPLREHKKLPLRIALPYLKSIQSSAINLGNGPVDIYVFVDPKCPRSQEFVSLISENKKMQKMYSYHLYLYELKRFNSKSLIESIYSSKKPLKALQSIMVEKKIVAKRVKTVEAAQKISRIEKVGQRLDVYKRPYLILVRKGKQ